MGMAVDQLCREPVYDVVNRKRILLFRHLSIKENLEQEVAEFARKFMPVTIVNGLENLISLFERIRLDGIKGLFAVPRASARTTQAGHDGNCAFETLSSGWHGRNHCK